MKKITFKLPKFTGFALGMILGMFLSASLIFLTAWLTHTPSKAADAKVLNVVLSLKPDPTPILPPPTDSDTSGIQAVHAKRARVP